MSLNEREKIILGAIIDNYLLSGDTIGSRTLVKKYSLDVSSATVRNAMADLEDMGYITKTHTSSGRVPTDVGYRFYLDELLKIREISKKEKEKIELAYERRMTELDGILDHTSRLLSKLTSYAGVAVEFTKADEKVKKIQLVHINNYSFMSVAVLENSNVKTRKVHLEASITEDELLKVQFELNKILQEDKNKYSYLETETLLRKLLEDKVHQALEDDTESEDETGFFIRGTENILTSLENKPAELVNALKVFDRHKDLRNIFESFVEKGTYEDGKVHVIFGDELNIPALEDFSFVFSKYNVKGTMGILGVLGPKRMEYSKTVALIKYVAGEVNRLIDNFDMINGES